jgi:heme A synthase
MVENDLTLKERERLNRVSAVVFVAVVLVLAVYFIYRMRTDPLKTIWDVLLSLGVPFAVGGSLAYLLPSEAFYYKRAKKPVGFHIRRVGLNVLFTFALYSLYLLMIGTSTIVFSETLNQYYAWLFGTALWLLIMYVIIFKRRQQRMRKILT